MNKEKVKLIVKNMELLIQSLKLELEESEIVSNSYKQLPLDDYDEVYYENED